MRELGAGLLAFFLGWAIMAMVMTTPAPAHDVHHPEHNDWYTSLKRPDNPTMSCCGLADAYWCDDVSVRDGQTYCKITDSRDDRMLGRPHIPNGTEFHIPNEKLKFDAGNPTGHFVLFVSAAGVVFCFVQGTGI